MPKETKYTWTKVLESHKSWTNGTAIVSFINLPELKF